MPVFHSQAATDFMFISVFASLKRKIKSITLIYLFLTTNVLSIFSCIFDHADFDCYKYLLPLFCCFFIIYNFLVNFSVFYVEPEGWGTKIVQGGGPCALSNLGPSGNVQLPVVGPKWVLITVTQLSL